MTADTALDDIRPIPLGDALRLYDEAWTAFKAA